MKDKQKTTKSASEPAKARKSDAAKKPRKAPTAHNQPRSRSQAAAEHPALDMSRIALVGSELAGIDDLMELCRRAVQLGRSELGFERLGIWLLDTFRPNKIRGTFGIDPQGNIRDEQSLLLSPPRSRFPARQVDDRFPKTHRKRIRRLVDLDRVTKGAADFMTSSLTDGHRCIGYLVADSLISGREFSTQECEAFSIYASILGHLLQNRITRRTLQEQNQQLAVLNTVAQAMAASRTPEKMGERLFEIIETLVSCDTFILCQYDITQEKLKAIYACDRVDGETIVLPRSDSFLSPTNDIRKMCSERTPLLVLRKDPEMDSKGWSRNGDQSRPSASLVFIPIISTDEVVGYYTVQSYALNAYTQKDVDLLTAIGKQVGNAFEALLLNEELRAREETGRKFGQHLLKLVEITNDLTSEESFDDLCRSAVELGRAKLGFERIGLWLSDEQDPETFHGTYGTDLNGQTRDEHQERISASQDQTMLQAQRVQLGVPFVQHQRPLHDPGSESERTGSLARAFLWDGKKNLGMLFTDTACTGRTISETEAELFLLYANVLGHLISREKAREELRVQNSRLAILSAVGEVLAGSLNAKQMCDGLLDILRVVMPCDCLLIGKCVPGTERIKTIALYDTFVGGKQVSFETGGFVPVGPCRKALRQAEPVVLFRDKPEDSIEGLETIGDTSRPSASLIFARLIVGDKPVGVLSVQSYTPRAYTEVDSQLVAAVAQRVGPALEVALLTEEIKEREEAERLFSQQLIQLVEVTNELTSETSLDQLCRSTVEMGRERLGFDRMAIWLMEKGERLSIRGTFGTDAQGNTRDERDLRDKIDEAMMFPESCLQESGAYLRELTPLNDMGVLVRDSGTRAWAWMWDGETSIGYVVIDNGLSGTPISQSQCRVLCLYASTLGHLIGRARDREKIRAQNERLAILNEVAHIIAGSRNITQMCESLVQILSRLLPCDAFVVSRSLPDSNRVLTLCLYDTLDGVLQPVPSIGMPYEPGGLLQEALKTRQVRTFFRQAEPQGNGGMSCFGSGEPSASALFAGLFVGDRSVGVISVQSYTPSAYADHHIDLFGEIAERVAPVFESALLTEELSEKESNQRLFGNYLIRLVEVTNELAVQKTLDDLFRHAVELGLTRLGFSRLSIWLCSPDGSDEIIGTFGTDFKGQIQDERDVKVVVPRDHFLAPIVFEGQPLVTESKQVEREHGSVTTDYAAAAIHDGNKLIGVIRTYSITEQSVSPQQQAELLRLLASTLGTLYSLKRAEDALRYSDQIYRTAIEKTSGVPYQLRYKNWSYDFVGSGAEALLGVPSDQLTLDRMGEMIQETVIPHLDGAVSPGEYANSFLRGERDLYQVDLLLRTADGQSKWISDTAIPLKDPLTEEVYGSLGILQDVTERKRVEWQLRENNEQLQALYSVARVTLGTLNLDNLCDKLVEVFRGLMPCDACIFDLYDPDRDTVTPLRLYDTLKGQFQTVPSVQSVLKPSGSMRKVIAERIPLLLHRKKPQVEREGFVAFGDASRPSASLLFAPMIAGDRVMGVLSIQSYTFNAYTDGDVDVMAAIAQQIGPAFEAALLSQDIRAREEQERTFGKQLATLVEITNELSVAESLDDMFRKAILCGHERLGFDRLSIWLLDSENPECIQGTFGTNESGELRDERESRIRWAPDSVMGSVLSGQSSFDVKSDVPLFDAAGKAVGRGIQVVVSIRVGQTTLGVLSVDNLLEGKEITEHHCEILRLYAASLGAITLSKRAKQELEQTHHIYREAIQNAQGVPYLLNYSTRRYDFIGSGCETLLGIRAQDMSYDLMESMVCENKPTLFGGESDPGKLVQSFIDGEVDRYQSDIRVKTPQGEEKWLSDSSVPVSDPRTGRVTHSIGILQDITQRKRIEEALRESESRFRTVAETTPSALMVVQDDHFTFVNPATAAITGYSVDEILQMRFWDFVHPDEQETVKQRSYARRKGLSAPDRYECRIVTKDGRTRWLDESVSMIELEGKPTVITVAYDITRRKRIEEEREALRRLSQALTAPLTLREIARMIAAECQRFFQYDAFWFDIYDPARRLFPGTYAEDTPADASTPQEVETESSVADGVTASVVLEAKAQRMECEQPIDDADASLSLGFVSQRARSLMYAPILWQGRGIGIISVQSHVVGRYTESDLSLLHSFADQCGGAIHRIRTEEQIRSSSRLEATATLAGGVAHDFNNLMVGVLGNAELLRMDLADNSEVQPMLDDIVEAAQRAGLLAQQMLAYARGGRYRPQAININKVVQETLDFQQRRVPMGIQLERRLEESLWTVNADPTQMSQVVMNLCNNAVDALGEQGLIIVGTENVELGFNATDAQEGIPPGRYVCLSVEDTGCGMSEEVRSRVFEPFYTTKFQGRGLGLAAVYGIVKNHGGNLIVHSEESVGTVFKVFIPATEMEASETVPMEEGLPKGTETILLVDDEQLVLKATRSLLEKLGYKVLIAQDGKHAISLARSHPTEIHLAILDLGMPVMSGSEAYPLLAQARPQMKIIICSGYDMKHTSETFAQQKGTLFVQKPFRASILAPIIRRALSESGTTGS